MSSLRFTALLKSQGLYDKVKAIAKQHAVEFDSVEAHSRFHELTGGE